MIASLANRILSFWNFVIFTVGTIIVITVGYIFVFDRDSAALPSLVYLGTFICGAIMVFVALMGIVGLRQHKKKVTEGKRNLVLVIYVMMVGLISIMIIVGGAISIKMNNVVERALDRDYEDIRVQYLEESVVEKLTELAQYSEKEWTDLQNAMVCCGYDNPKYLLQ